MRLLHTSDWHLGQTLHDFDRTYEHERFLGWLLDEIERSRPDALLIAGDVFDNANPSARAQHLFYRFLADARRRAPQLTIVITAGNHDSAVRLEAAAPVLGLFDTTVVGQIHRLPDQTIDVERLVTPLPRADGTVGAWCLALPFLRPSDVPRVDEATDPYLAGVEALYRQAYAVAATRREAGQAIIAMGHCHMLAARTSESSERRIVIGGAEALSADIFDEGIAYAALGHLHLAQPVGDRSTIRYSGSPLPMSFAEIDYPHQILRIDLDGGSVAGIESIPVPRSVALLRVPARHARLDAVLPAVAQLATQHPATTPPEQQPYLEVRVRLDAPEPALRAQVEAALGDAGVRLVRIDPVSSAGEGDDAPAVHSLGDLDRLAPEDVFARLCDERIAADAPDRAALLAALQTAFLELSSDPLEEAA